jgi:hypothetical protein
MYTDTLVRDLTSMILQRLDCNYATIKSPGQKAPTRLWKMAEKKTYQSFKLAYLLSKIQEMNELEQYPIRGMVSFTTAKLMEHNHQFENDDDSTRLLEWYTSPEKLLGLRLDFEENKDLSLRFCNQTGSNLVRFLMEYILLAMLMNVYQTSSVYHARAVNITTRSNLLQIQFPAITHALHMPPIDFALLIGTLQEEHRQWILEWTETEKAELAAFHSRQASTDAAVSRNLPLNRLCTSGPPQPPRAPSPPPMLRSAALTEPKFSAIRTDPSLFSAATRYSPPPATATRYSPPPFSAAHEECDGYCCDAGGASRNDMSSVHCMAVKNCNCYCHNRA